MSHPHHVGAAWARVALPRGPECHVSSTWVPSENKPLFAFILIVLIDLKSKINSEKSLKIRKFITFKIQFQINPDFFSFDVKFNYLSL